MFVSILCEISKFLLEYIINRIVVKYFSLKVSFYFNLASPDKTAGKHFINSNGRHSVSPINANKKQSKLFTEHLQKK